MVVVHSESSPLGRWFVAEATLPTLLLEHGLVVIYGDAVLRPKVPIQLLPSDLLWVPRYAFSTLTAPGTVEAVSVGCSVLPSPLGLTWLAVGRWGLGGAALRELFEVLNLSTPRASTLALRLQLGLLSSGDWLHSYRVSL